MAKSQLKKISEYTSKLYDMIPEGYDLEDWMRTKISQMADDVGEVYHALDHRQDRGVDIASSLMKMAKDLIGGMPSAARKNNWLKYLNWDRMSDDVGAGWPKGWTVADATTSDIVNDAKMSLDDEGIFEMVDAVRIMSNEFPSVKKNFSRELKKLESALDSKKSDDEIRTELVSFIVSQLRGFKKVGWSSPSDINKSVGILNLMAKKDTEAGDAEYNVSIHRERGKPGVKVFGSVSVSRDTDFGAYVWEYLEKSDIIRIRKAVEVVETVFEVKDAHEAGRLCFWAYANLPRFVKKMVTG